MKTEIDLYQQPGYATKIILQRDTAERLMQLENELRIHTLFLCPLVHRSLTSKCGFEYYSSTQFY
ncbi:hypothetical protein BDV93DRAFT_520234 [Ceratobasidium sp. AG-I]|nr:hypothetical protein BDV93DRAFT_520234 [Ceratobasidium sp. AG-I]